MQEQMIDCSDQAQQMQATLKYSTCNRVVYRCLYCLNDKGIINDYCSRKILSHVRNSHQAALKKLNIFKNFKLQINRDISNTQTKCEEQEKVSPKKKSKITKKSKKIIQQEIKENNQNECDEDLELDDDFKDEINQQQQYLVKQIIEQSDSEINYRNYLNDDEVGKLKKTIIIQNQIIAQLINCSKFMNDSKGSKNILTQHILQGQDKYKKKSELKQLTKKVIQNIEFSGDNIRKKIDEIKQTYSHDSAVQEFLIQEFQQKSLIFLIETFESFFNDFRLSTDNKNEKQDIAVNLRSYLDIKAIENQRIEQEKFREQVHKQFMNSLIQKERLEHQYIDQKFDTPPIKIQADIFKKDALKVVGEKQLELRGELFSGIEIDYPWPLDFENKQGKKFLNYKTQSIQNLFNLQIEHLQEQGYCFMWTISSFFTEAMAFLLYKGYSLLKKTKKGGYVNRMGYHVRHNKEICLIGLKGNPPPEMQPYRAQDIIEAVAEGNSKKPIEIKFIMKNIIPGKSYCSLFDKDWNEEFDYVSIGDELTIQ